MWIRIPDSAFLYKAIVPEMVTSSGMYCEGSFVTGNKEAGCYDEKQEQRKI